ncbi:MAG TPA: PadR family transcriptional regulator [Gemmatimonadales bacterium]|jgi:transcriptional regulator
MAQRTMALLPGTIELLILRALRWEPTHSAGIAEWIRLVTGSAFALEDGTIYPALHRMERDGLIESEWGKSDRNRKARFYNLTSDGRGRLKELIADWARYEQAVDAAIRHGHPRALWAQRTASLQSEI